MSHALSSITFRPVIPADIPDLLQLWLDTEGLGHSPGDTPEELTHFLQRNPELSTAAITQDSLVGAILCGHDGRRGYIYRLAVAFPYRNQGIATRLVHRSLSQLKKQGICRVQTFVLANNSDALSFWQRQDTILRDDLVMFSIDLF